jgi:1-acyl-sn-glycerol-3-phosphate acyltransferase
MRRLGQLLSFYLLLLWLGAMLLLGNVLSVPLVLLPARVREPLMQTFISATFRLFLRGCCAFDLMRLDLRALDALNARQGGLLLVANHPSMIDVFLVLSRVRHALCLMKSDLSSNVFLATGARLAGYISNRRTDRMIRSASQALRSGHRLLVFPEGTRTVQWPLNRLKPGVGLIAKRAQAPLQTILIRTNSPYLCKGWPIWRPPTFPVIYRAWLGACVPASDSVADVVERLQYQFVQELEGKAPLDPTFRL